MPQPSRKSAKSQHKRSPKARSILSMFITQGWMGLTLSKGGYLHAPRQDSTQRPKNSRRLLSNCVLFIRSGSLSTKWSKQQAAKQSSRLNPNDVEDLQEENVPRSNSTAILAVQANAAWLMDRESARPSLNSARKYSSRFAVATARHMEMHARQPEPALPSNTRVNAAMINSTGD